MKHRYGSDNRGGLRVDKSVSHSGANVGPHIGMRCELLRDHFNYPCGTKGKVTGLRQLGMIRVLFDGADRETRVPSVFLKYTPATPAAKETEMETETEKTKP